MTCQDSGFRDSDSHPRNSSVFVHHSSLEKLMKGMDSPSISPPPKKTNTHWLSYTHQLIHSLRGLAPQHHRVSAPLPALLVALTHCWLMLNWLTTTAPATSKNFCKARPLLSSYLLKHHYFSNIPVNFPLAV